MLLQLIQQYWYISFYVLLFVCIVMIGKCEIKMKRLQWSGRIVEIVKAENWQAFYFALGFICAMVIVLHWLF